MSEQLLMIGGLVALLALRFGLPPIGGIPNLTQASPDMPDVWATPYYLRYNTAVFDDTGVIMPSPSTYTFALGVPAQATANRVIQTG